MIKVENLSYSYPQKNLYENISFTIEEGNHCAFIGSSGSGKSTLINIIMNPEEIMFKGKVEVLKNCKIGYVSQFSEIDKRSEITVFEFIADKFLMIQNKIDLICKKMENSLDIESLLEEYQNYLDEFDAIDGNNFENNINSKLSLVNLLKNKDLKVSELSGGEFKLIQVIKEMLTNPDLIIMDEPDVFLDFENLNSLRKLINSHKRTLLIITHNRYLLDHCFNKVLHLENMKIQEFEGKYVDYNFSLLQTKIEMQELAFEDEEEIKRNEKIIDKLRSLSTDIDDASLGRALKARVKIQERLEKNKTKAPFVDIRKIKIDLETDNIIEESIALKVSNYSLVFDEILLENIDFEIKSNEKVAIIGSNGTGKTTFLRDIFYRDTKSIELNKDIDIAYLSQIQGETLNESKTIIDEFLDSGFDSIEEIRNYLLNYGFDKTNIEQNISSLSGGEKNILQIAKVASKKTGMLLLDEPTSHLDIYSQIELERALKEYKGSIIMVSHDYYSIANCMDYVLLVEDNKIRKMSMRKFRKMIYANHFDKDYLEVEQKKKAIELKIAKALEKNNFELAKDLIVELEDILKIFSKMI